MNFIIDEFWLSAVFRPGYSSNLRDVIHGLMWFIRHLSRDRAINLET